MRKESLSRKNNEIVHEWKLEQGCFITSIVLAIQHHTAKSTLTFLRNTSLEKKCMFHYISGIMFQQHPHGSTPPVD